MGARHPWDAPPTSIRQQILDVHLHFLCLSLEPILIATSAVALSVSEFLRVTQGPRDRWAPPAFNQPLALARAQDFVVTVTPMQIVVALAGLAAAGAVVLLL